MACRFSEPVVDSRDPEPLAASWAEVLGYERGPRPRRTAPTIVSAPVAGPTPGEVRLHLDVSPTDRDQDAELERLLAPGATTRAGTCWPTRRATSSASCAAASTHCDRVLKGRST